MSTDGLIRTEAQHKAMLKALRSASKAGETIGVDTETTGLRMYLDDHVRGISIAVRQCIDGKYVSGHYDAWYLPIAYPDTLNFSPQRLVRILNRHKGLTAWHNANGVDWSGLVKACPEFKIPEGRFHDTMVDSWLIDENVDHRLKQLCARYFGEDAKAEQNHIKQLKKGRPRGELYKELRETEEWGKPRPAAEARAEAARLSDESKKSWETFTAEDLAAYAARDAELTLMLMDAQVGPYGSTNAALDREHRLQGVLHRMMQLGIRVNKEKCIDQATVAQARLEELAAKFPGLNLNSVPQMSKLIYEDWGMPVKHRTKTGAPSTAKEALEELEGHAEVRDLLEYRGLAKAMSGYYRPLYETIADDGRIHPSFSSSRTVTGRLSCSAPNLMTIPRADTLVGVRDIFRAADGYELWEYDLAQAELRIMASFCQDETLMGALDRGDDLHSLTAERVFGPDFTPLQRRLGKNLNYGFPYGIGPRKFAKYRVAGTSASVTECGYWPWRKDSGLRRPRRCGDCHVCMSADDLEGYRRAYPKLVQLMAGLERVARRDGVLPLHVDGRYRHFRSPGTIVHYYTALNAVVQGGVAELMKDVMLVAEPRLTAMGARLCLQVHDSLVVEVLPGTGMKVAEMIQGVLDEIDAFEMRMLLDASPWDAHA